MAITEGKATLPDGFEVYTRTAIASPERARLLFFHGFSDHSNNYDDFFLALSRRGISVHSFDQRGWGRSIPTPAHKGRTGPTAQVYSDMSHMLSRLLAPTDSSPTPLFLAGHSMGGLNTLSYTCADPAGLTASLRGLIVLSPLIALHASSRPSAFTVHAGKLASRVFPHRHLVNKLDPSFLSRREEKNLAWQADELNHDTGTLGGLSGMLDRADALESCVARLDKGKMQGGMSRVLVAHGTGDQVNDYEATRRWFETACEAEDRRLHSPEGWRHNLHWEQEGDEFTTLVADWILERSGPLDDKPAGSGAPAGSAGAAQTPPTACASKTSKL